MQHRDAPPIEETIKKQDEEFKRLRQSQNQQQTNTQNQISQAQSQAQARTGHQPHPPQPHLPDTAFTNVLPANHHICVMRVPTPDSLERSEK